MKTLIFTFLVLQSLSLFAADCSLYIGNISKYSKTDHWKTLQQAQKMMTAKGYVLVNEASAAKYVLTGEFLNVKYLNDEPGLLATNFFTALMSDNDRFYKMEAESESFYRFSDADLRSIKKALKLFPTCTL